MNISHTIGLAMLGWLALSWSIGWSPGNSQPPEPAAPSLALLVGCTQYPNHPKLRELYGPGNDVPMWAALLTDPHGFAFAKDNVTQLVGWPDAPARRPTSANIVRGFESLIERVRPGSRVVIVLSGHGIQVPIPPTQKDPLDPANPEPDGMDEVFLPADVAGWTDTGLHNAITDDQMGKWLNQLRSKGAHVLVVFDCCHSGTMTRSGEGVREINRTASPELLKIPEQAIKAASERAKQAVEAAKRAGRAIPSETPVPVSAKPGPGSLVAFYAAQSFEEAPELPFPDDAPLSREYYFGVLSWNLVQTLKTRQGPLTYAELQRLVAGKYRAVRGTRPPTPFAEGDLDREVLGLTAWPARPAIYLERDGKGQLSISAGLLQAVSKDSVLAVGPPPGDARSADDVLGYVRVTSVGPSAAKVVAVVKQDQDWVQAADGGKDLPQQGRCRLVVRDLGEMRVKLHLDDAALKAVIDGLAGEVREQLAVQADAAQADWLLRLVSPEQARVEFGLAGLERPQVLLVQQRHDAATTAQPNPPNPPTNRRVFGQYPAPAADAQAQTRALRAALERDLPRIFKWQNVWRLANGVSEAEGGQTHGLSLEVLLLRDENDRQGQLLHAGVVRDGQEMLFRARNGGAEPLWLTAFYLDAKLGIQIVYDGGINAGQALTLGQGTATAVGGWFGPEGVVVFAVPQRAVVGKPNYALLEQEPIAAPAAIKRGPYQKPAHPFERLLNQASFGQGSRGFTVRVPSTPAILSQAWHLTPTQ